MLELWVARCCQSGSSYCKRVALGYIAPVSKSNVLLVPLMLDHRMASARGKESVPTSSSLCTSLFTFHQVRHNIDRVILHTLQALKCLLVILSSLYAFSNHGFVDLGHIFSPATSSPSLWQISSRSAMTISPIDNHEESYKSHQDDNEIPLMRASRIPFR